MSWLDLTPEEFEQRLKELPVPDKLLKRLANTPVVPEWQLPIPPKEHLIPKEKSQEGHEQLFKRYFLYSALGKPTYITRGELDVLRGISVGLTGKETAEVLGIGINSVETSIKRMIRRLRARNIVHVVLLAAKQNVL